jgi:flagellar assembly protein FliH
VKNLLYRSRVTQDEGVVPFDMPTLKMDRGSDDALSVTQNVDNIEREAYEKGFEVGEKAGFAMGEQKAMVLVEKLENIIKELTTLEEKLIRELEPQLVELAVSIARKIILKELTFNPDEIVEITKEALMRLERAGQITIKINPSLYDLFVKHKPEIQSIHPDIVFDVDPTAPLYGSVVMGPLEEVVTDVDEQLKNLIKDMSERLGQYDS